MTFPDFDDVDLAIVSIAALVFGAMALDLAPDGLPMAGIAAIAGLARGRKAPTPPTAPHPEYIVTDE